MRRNSRDVTSPRPSKYNNKNIKTRNLTASGPLFFALSDGNAATRRAARSGIRWRLFLRFASTACRGDDVEALPQRDGGAGLVHGVEMQARRTAVEQVLTELGGYVEAEGAQRFHVVAVSLQPLAYPARDFGAAGIGETRELYVIGDGHDAGHYRYVDGHLLTTVDEVKISVGVVKILSDGGVGTGLDLAFKTAQIGSGVVSLRMKLGIGRDFDEEMIAGFAADEFDQFVCVAELAGLAHARGHVAAQRDQVANALRFVVVEYLSDVVLGRADARQVRRNIDADFPFDFAHGFEGAFLGRSAGAERHRGETGFQRRKLQIGLTQFCRAFLALGREEFDAVCLGVFFLGVHDDQAM